MISEIIKSLKDRQARADAVNLPTPEEFEDLSSMFNIGAVAGGAHLNAGQCEMFSRMFATLSVAVIAVNTE